MPEDFVQLFQLKEGFTLITNPDIRETFPFAIMKPMECGLLQIMQFKRKVIRKLLSRDIDVHKGIAEVLPDSCLLKTRPRF